MSVPTARVVVPWLQRLRAWLGWSTLPPPAFCSRCGCIVEGDPNIKRLYRGRSHIECSGQYEFDPMTGGPKIPCCSRFQTYSM